MMDVRSGCCENEDAVLGSRYTGLYKRRRALFWALWPNSGTLVAEAHVQLCSHSVRPDPPVLHHVVVVLAMSLQALWRCTDLLRNPFKPAGESTRFVDHDVTGALCAQALAVYGRPRNVLVVRSPTTAALPVSVWV